MTESSKPHGDDAYASDSNPSTSSEDDALRGWWYLLLLPGSFLYSVAAREFAGHGYGGAMVFFLLAAIGWPLFAILITALVKTIFRIQGLAASVIGLFCWMLSCVTPFVIGVK